MKKVIDEKEKEFKEKLTALETEFILGSRVYTQEQLEVLKGQIEDLKRERKKEMIDDIQKAEGGKSKW